MKDDLVNKSGDLVNDLVNDCISRQAAIDAMMKLQTEDIEAYGASIPEGFDGDRAVAALKALPSATDINVGGNLIDRRAALDALGERPVVWTDKIYYILGARNQYDMDRLAIETVPSAQLAQDLTNGCTDTISRAAIVDAIEGVDWYHMTDSGEMVHGANSAEDQPWYKAEDIYVAIEALPSAQPGCEDAVSRFAVLRLIDYSSHDLNDAVDNRYMQNEIKQLPSVTPKQPGWIPTSERLPDNDRAVLVTLKWAEDDYEVAVGEYWHNSTASHGWGSFEGHVIAWHELPTPYREGGQE